MSAERNLETVKSALEQLSKAETAKITGRAIKIAHLDPYLPLHDLADYSGLSVRTLRDYLADPIRALPHYRLGGKILVRKSEFDEWMAAHRTSSTPVNVHAIVDDMMGRKTGR